MARAMASGARAFARWCAAHWPGARERTVRAVITILYVSWRTTVVLARWTARNWPFVRHQLGVAALATARTMRLVAVGVARWLSAHHRLLGRAGRRLSMVVVTAVVVALAVVLTTVVTVRAGVAAIAFSARFSTHVRLPPLARRSVVYAADGSVITVLHAVEDREPVPLSHISPTLVHAVVDTEDAHYWHHGGIDAGAVLRALRADVTAGRIRQGGSTIAQQLVKTTLLAPRHDFRRKLDEMVLAERVVHQLGKRAVLERYLNTVYFGEGAYGVETAAETYFGVSAAKVDTAQAALLAGLIQHPDGYDPIRAPAAARQRRQSVLASMAQHHHLGHAAAAAAASEPLPSRLHRPPQTRDYFSDAVVQSLLADHRLGATRQDRYRRVFGGGLRIRTTLDPTLQRQAQQAVAAGIPAGHHLSAALAAVDPATGAVRAVVGGPDFGVSEFDTALAGAGRQPGSAFKVFTLIAALEHGSSPARVIDGSSPCTIPNPGGTPNPWKPANFEGEAFGPITLADATAHSVNCAYARLALQVGLARVAETAHRMGITAPLQVVPSMTLGTNTVTPLQMASAYATLAADGVHHRPHLVSQVNGPDGKLMFSDDDAPERVLSQQVARAATQMLLGVVDHGTGTAAAVPGRQVAGKTGTTEDYQDAWFVGYTPELATAVWMGDPSGEVPMRDVQGINVIGGSFPARLWSAFMGQALANVAPSAFPQPDPALMPPASSATPAPGSTTPVTTWCSSSCAHPGKHGPK